MTFDWSWELPIKIFWLKEIRILYYEFHVFQPKVVVSASCGVEPGKSVPYKPMLDGALSSIDFKPNKCVIYNRPGVGITTMINAGCDIFTVLGFLLQIWITIFFTLN